MWCFVWQPSVAEQHHPIDIAHALPAKNAGATKKVTACAWAAINRAMAVYTQLTNEQIAEFLDTTYDVGALNFAVGIAQGVENSNYLVAVCNAVGEEVKYILTLYEKRVNPADLPFFLDLLTHVAARGVACPKPIARRDGALFGELAGKQASLVSFLYGKSRSVIRNPHAASVGNVLGQLHRATEGFLPTRTNALSLEGWQKIYAKIEGKLDAIQQGLETLVRDELQHMVQHFSQVDGLPHGVIHADLFPDNVFFEGDEVSGIIDFYFACNDALAYDVAITLNAWCFEPRGEFSPTKSKLLLSAYAKQRPFAAAEIAAFSTLLRGAALRFLLTRAHDWIYRDPNALVRPHDPLEYAAKLRFHQRVKDVGEYGL
jgi:homoserine kinase type II